jgi:hypothetical protein
MSGQLYAQAALPQGKERVYPPDRLYRRSGAGDEEKNSFHCRESNSVDQSMASRSVRACDIIPNARNKVINPSTGNTFSWQRKANLFTTYKMWPVARIKPTFVEFLLWGSCHAGVSRCGWAPENKLNRNVNRINERPLSQWSNRFTLWNEPFFVVIYYDHICCSDRCNKGSGTCNISQLDAITPHPHSFSSIHHWFYNWVDK